MQAEEVFFETPLRVTARVTAGITIWPAVHVVHVAAQQPEACVLPALEESRPVRILPEEAGLRLGFGLGFIIGVGV